MCRPSSEPVESWRPIILTGKNNPRKTFSFKFTNHGSVKNYLFTYVVNVVISHDGSNGTPVIDFKYNVVMYLSRYYFR